MNTLYAGYGANRDPQMIEAIVGQPAERIAEVALMDVELCIQRIDQTPNRPAAGSPVQLSIREILESDDSWGKDSDFKTYTIRRKQGGVVLGSLFSLTEQQRKLIAEWEMIEYGWFEAMKVRVELPDASRAVAETEGLRHGQAIDRVIKGLHYPRYINDKDKMLAMAAKIRRDYLDRQ
jgi:hypothetical protein